MIDLTPENSCAFASDRLNWSDQTFTRPVPPFEATWIVSLMSVRSPCSRCAELGPIASVSTPPFTLPRNAGRLNGMSNSNSLIRANSNSSLIDVMNSSMIT